MIRTGSPADLTPSHIAISGRHACKSLYSDGLTCTVLSYQEFGVVFPHTSVCWSEAGAAGMAEWHDWALPLVLGERQIFWSFLGAEAFRASSAIAPSIKDSAPQLSNAIRWATVSTRFHLTVDGSGKVALAGLKGSSQVYSTSLTNSHARLFPM